MRPEKLLLNFLDAPRLDRAKLSAQLDKLLAPEVDRAFLSEFCSPRSGYSLATCLAYRWREGSVRQHHRSVLDRVQDAGVDIARPDARQRYVGFASLAEDAPVRSWRPSLLEFWQAIGQDPTVVQPAWEAPRVGQSRYQWPAISVLSVDTAVRNYARTAPEPWELRRQREQAERVQAWFLRVWEPLEPATRASRFLALEQAPIAPCHASWWEDLREPALKESLAVGLPQLPSAAPRPRL